MRIFKYTVLLAVLLATNPFDVSAATTTSSRNLRKKERSKKGKGKGKGGKGKGKGGKAGKGGKGAGQCLTEEALEIRVNRTKELYTGFFMACDISGIRLNAEFTNSELRNTYIANQYVRQIVATEGPPNQLGLQIGAIGNVFVGLWDFDLNQITGNAFFIIQGDDNDINPFACVPYSDEVYPEGTLSCTASYQSSPSSMLAKTESKYKLTPLTAAQELQLRTNTSYLPKCPCQDVNSKYDSNVTKAECVEGVGGIWNNEECGSDLLSSGLVSDCCYPCLESASFLKDVPGIEGRIGDGPYACPDERPICISLLNTNAFNQSGIPFQPWTDPNEINLPTLGACIALPSS